jgi:hypothetical protein
LERKERKISSSIPSIKQDKEEGGDIVAKNVGRPSHPLLERHITDYKAQEHPSMKWCLFHQVLLNVTIPTNNYGSRSIFELVL